MIWSAAMANSGGMLFLDAVRKRVDPRFMVNMARVASKAKLGRDTVRRGAHQYFSTMNRSTRMISRLLLSPELLERLSPPLRAAGEYGEIPDIVFYTGCNIIKTPHRNSRIQ
jgi:heterodisulfide reductase subunit D